MQIKVRIVTEATSKLLVLQEIKSDWSVWINDRFPDKRSRFSGNDMTVGESSKMKHELCLISRSSHQNDRKKTPPVQMAIDLCKPMYQRRNNQMTAMLIGLAVLKIRVSAMELVVRFDDNRINR